jgi:hypothetical protein
MIKRRLIVDYETSLYGTYRVYATSRRGQEAESHAKKKPLEENPYLELKRPPGHEDTPLK